MARTFDHTLAEVLLNGKEYEYYIDFAVTHWGSSPSWDDPGSPIELEIRSVTMIRPDGSEQRMANWSDAQNERWTEAILLYVTENLSEFAGEPDYD